MALNRTQKNILINLLQYKIIAQSKTDVLDLFFLGPEGVKIYTKGHSSFRILKDAGMIIPIKSIRNYTYYKISDTGLLQATITSNRKSLKPINKYF